MRQRWQMGVERFSGLSRRERGMIALATSLLALFLCYLPLETVWLSQAKANKTLASLTQENALSTQQLELYRQRLSLDPDADYRQRLASLEQQMRELDTRLDAQMVDMVPANTMPQLLAELLGKVKGIKLLSFASIPPVPLLQVGETDKKMNLYSHGIGLTLEGDYFSTLRFFDEVEAMPNKLYWKRLDYRVHDYPKAHIELELYTLSINKDFISVAK
ncbi:MSHA biogenesis protein MshJ [Shewanella salipaludis]|uniref:MSHA biogenesis protein MshJ n=1 Tax=Shewanella salipaludis TaxID=2723052 RepID=A0A972FTW9_9GAMM|nr:MSHA biogenesis protein MshJ [Shewanella salipaludis]NMH65209.1 MSHA biogenesis protein MshJ [Shewanella salipaludis]